jgi:hypothetical protein
MQDHAGNPNTDRRKLFEDKLKREMAKQLGISEDRLEIEGVFPD